SSPYLSPNGGGYVPFARQYYQDGIEVPEYYVRNLLEGSGVGGQFGLLEWSARMSTREVGRQYQTTTRTDKEADIRMVDEDGSASDWSLGGSSTNQHRELVGIVYDNSWTVAISLIGVLQQTLGNPPKVGTNKEEEIDRFNKVWKELEKRLQNPECSKLFGGFENAKKALLGTNFQFVTLNGPRSEKDQRHTVAATDGKKILINSQGAFMAKDGILIGWDDRKKIKQGITYYENGKITGAMFENDVTFGAFVLLHELGHRRNVIESKDNGDDEKTARNNTKIIEACFKSKPN
ncbi:MAG TPA: hypothetical protein VF540_12090, partial [Segetibacter sp.]